MIIEVIICFQSHIARLIKQIFYIKITNERWPKIQAVKNLLKDGAEYIGPYYSASITNNTVEEISKIYKLPNCNRSFDKKTKPCLNYHIGLCFAPCIKQISNAEYAETINSAVKHIKNGGISEQDIQKLNVAMEQAAEKLDFEYADGRAYFTVPKVDIHQMVEIK